MALPPHDQGIRDIEHDLGVYALGGKGATSSKTPTEILDRCERLAVEPGPLLHASRMAAKVTSAALQDGYQLCQQAYAPLVRGGIRNTWIDCSRFRQRGAQFFPHRSETSTKVRGDSQHTPSSVQYFGLPFLLRGKS